MKHTIHYLLAAGFAAVTAASAHAGPQEAANYFKKVETWYCKGEPYGVGRPPTAARIAMNIMPDYSVVLYQNEALQIRGEKYSRLLRYEGKATLTESGFSIESTSVTTESEGMLPGFGNWSRPFSLKLDFAPREDHQLDYAFTGTSKSSAGTTDLFCFADTYN
ncbi:hypothetical protein WNY37_07455 [Henriciella sp. AS95]|uniref:hypothetical protein n=1 Tax=Henriciella sp. AS95 TaxID=3135782 RepID=UPI003170E22D